MDQVTKLYEELVGYDPSLAQNKEAVLQLIEKMLAAKPLIIARPQWQESFGHELARHIAERKIMSPAPASSPFAKFTKRSYSLATFLVAIMVVGGSYYWYTSNKTTVKKPNNTQTTTQSPIASDHTTGNIEINDSMNATADQQVAVNDATAGVDADIHVNGSYENSSLALRNSQTIKIVTNSSLPPVDPSATILTHIDMEKADNGSMSKVAVGGGIGGGVNGYAGDDKGEGTANASALVAPDAPQATPADARTTHATAIADERLEVALLFVDGNGIVTTTAILDILKAERITATFVEVNDDTEIQLQKMGYEVRTNIGAIHALTLSEKTLNSIIATEGDMVIRVDVDMLASAQLLRPLIEKLQARGYVFVHLSTLTK